MRSDCEFSREGSLRNSEEELAESRGLREARSEGLVVVDILN